MLEKYLVDYCSPTLASVKTANLFAWMYASKAELLEQLSYWNLLMNPKGVFLYAFRTCDTKALIYVCRKKLLTESLNRPGVPSFLSQYGYQNMEADDAILRLRARFASKDDFPHEIGLFLDYPLDDVIGFIENGGQNYIYSGYWKVYVNENETRALFAKYQKCRDLYARLWQEGRSAFQLTVAV